jgi:hypothetical protein
MTGNDCNRKADDPVHWQPHHQGEEEHGRAERPDHAKESPRELKAPGGPYDREFQHNEPNTARPQKSPHDSALAMDKWACTFLLFVTVCEVGLQRHFGGVGGGFYTEMVVKLAAEVA